MNCPNDLVFKRISAAGIILNAIRTNQSKDGVLDLPPTIKSEYGDYIRLLCEAGFVRKIEVSENGLPYRITWEGLCFLDTFELFNQATKVHSADAVQGFIAMFSIFLFY